MLTAYLFFFFLTFFYLFLRQGETEHEQGRVRERETQNLKQAPGSEPSAQSPPRGSNSRTARSWPELKSDAEPTKPPRHPSSLLIHFSFSQTPRFFSPHQLRVMKSQIQTLNLAIGLVAKNSQENRQHCDILQGKPFQDLRFRSFQKLCSTRSYGRIYLLGNCVAFSFL